MKRILSIFLVLALFSATFAFEPYTAYGAEDGTGTPALKYHLDMGVYVVAKTGGSWAKGVAFESEQPYTANLKFGNNIKAKRVMSIEEAKSEEIDIWDANVCSNNLAKGVYDNTKDAYDFIYKDAVSINISERKINSNTGNSLSYSAKVLLDSDVPYNLVKKYNDYKKIYDTVTIITYEKDQTTAQKIAQLEAERDQLWDILKNLGSTGVPPSLMPQYQRYVQIVSKELPALRAKSQYTRREEVLESYRLDVQGFIDETFKFWGSEGKGPGSGYQNLHDLNLSMWQMLVNMSEMKDIPEGTEYYLVFLPTVIEYEEAAPIDDPAPPILVPDTSGSCKDKITWSETKSHTYTTGSGENKVTHTCYHRYYYEATLSSTAKLTADKPNGAPLAFKSGYGFSVTMSNTVSVHQVNDNGSCGDHKNKPYTKTVTAPTSAEVRTGWKVPNTLNKKTQPSTVALQRSSGSSLASSFVTAPNPVSNYNKALIYTDVKLAGTKQNPVKHTITVYTQGGGVNGVAFCESVPLSFSINGNMFEDDSTADRKI